MTVQIAYLIFVRFAYVEHEDVFSGIEAPFQLFRLNLGNVCCHWSFLTANSTKLLVVDQFRYGPIRSAHRAIGILAQLQLAKAHSQCIHKQQSPDQRVASSQDQFNGFRRLNDANQTGKNAEHPAFGTGRNQSRRRRFWIQAAIARTILYTEDACLPFKAKNRAIDVWLACQNARIVYQIAGWKIVGTIHDDIEVFKDAQSVVAAETRVETDYVHERINCFDLFCCRIEFLAAHIGGGVNDLALKIGEVHYVEVDQSKRAHAGGRKIERQWRTKPAGADAKHARCLKLLLTFHSH